MCFGTQARQDDATSDRAPPLGLCRTLPPAAYSTGNLILVAIKNVIVRRVSAMFDQLRKERGQPFLSGQLDLWSLGLGT